MIDYCMRVTVQGKVNWRDGCAAVWTELSKHSEQHKTAFALSLCPDRPHALLVGSLTSIDWANLKRGFDEVPSETAAALLVEIGSFNPQVPLGIAQLADIRDEFRCAMFEDLSCLMRSYAPDDLGRLLPIAETFLLLDRVEWADGKRLWPLSLNGQLWAFSQSGGDARRMTAEAGDKLVPALRDSEQQNGILRHDESLPGNLANRVATLQLAYDRIRSVANGMSEVDRVNLSESAAQLLTTILSGTHTADEARETASHPSHMAFRVFMSLIYDLGPLIALSPTRRFITFHAIMELLRGDYPSRIAEATEGGNQLRQRDS